MKEIELRYPGLEPSDVERIKSSLVKISPHLRQRDFVLVGGIPIRHHLEMAGQAILKEEFNDLDIVALSEDTVNPSVSENFLIYHRHKTHCGSYFSLVDPETAIKTDIFDSQDKPNSPVLINFENGQILVASPEDSYIHLIVTLHRVTQGQLIDPKWLSNLKRLESIIDTKKVNDTWNKKHTTRFKRTREEKINAIEKATSNNPSLIKSHPFRRNKPYKCTECINSPEFPLADMEKVFSILQKNT